MVTSLVIGVDGSDGARVALAWAAGLIAAERERGRDVDAVAVTAWDPPLGDAALFTGLIDAEELEDDAASRLDAALDELDHPEWFDRVISRGSSADVLIEEADRIDADLVVVGSRGRSGLAKVLLGSVSRAVAARADRPVAVVPPASVWAPGPTVVGYDGSPGADAALRWAVDNLPGPFLVVSAWFLPADAIYDRASIDVEGFERDVRERVEAAIAAVSPPGGGLDLEPVVQRDDPRLALLNRSLGATSIVMGARAHRGVKGLLLGSTVDYAATHADVPVLVIPPPHHADDGGREG